VAFVQLAQLSDVGFLVCVWAGKIVVVVVIVLAEKALPELRICSFIFAASLDWQPQEVKARAMVPVKVSAAELAADTSARQVAPKTSVSLFTFQASEHRVDVDPLFALR
jgi:hypothetical protein